MFHCPYCLPHYLSQAFLFISLRQTLYIPHLWLTVYPSALAGFLLILTIECSHLCAWLPQLSLRRSPEHFAPCPYLHLATIPVLRRCEFIVTLSEYAQRTLIDKLQRHLHLLLFCTHSVCQIIHAICLIWYAIHCFVINFLTLRSLIRELSFCDTQLCCKEACNVYLALMFTVSVPAPHYSRV